MGPIEPRPLDDEGLPRPPPVRGKLSRWLLRAMVHAESVMFLAIAVALLAIAVVVFARGVHDLVLAPPHEQFAVTITKAVNDVLFIVIVLELLRTIVSLLEGGGFQLQPFLVIRMISATRYILTVVRSCRWSAGRGRPPHDDRTGRQRRRGGRVVGGPGSHTAFRPA